MVPFVILGILLGAAVCQDAHAQLSATGAVVRGSADSTPKWNLIWMAEKEWEAEYIEKVLLGDLPLDAHEIPPLAWCEPVESCLADGIVVIVGRSAYEHQPGQIDRLLEAAKKRGTISIVIHISDEQCSMGTSWYPLATLVARQYWCEPQSLAKNVVTMPCGLKTGWNYTHDVLSADKRRCKWAFYGHTGGARSVVRENMKREMMNVPGGCSPPLTTEAENQHNLGGAAYTAQMCNTIIAPCPRGYGLETFRFNEALECGGIPIVDDGGKVFHKYMPGILDHVITTNVNWTHTISGEPLAEYVQKLLRDPTELERRRLGVMGWYHEYKRTLLNRIRQAMRLARKH